MKFVGKRRAVSTRRCATLRINDSKTRMAVSFRNMGADIASFVEFAVSDDGMRLYFRFSENDVGYKLSRDKYGALRTTMSLKGLPPTLLAFDSVTHYYLQYDAELGLYFVERV